MAEPTRDEITPILAEGEAALWLVESLIYALLENKGLSREAILESIEDVIEGKSAETVEGRNPEISRIAAAQLRSISGSIGAKSAGSAPTGAKPRQRRRRK